MLNLVSFLVTALCAVTTVQGHTYHLGECPIVEPIPDFQMPKFLGLWYAIQKTSTSSRCLTYNFTAEAEPNEYLLEQVSEHPVLGIASVDNKYHYTGKLRTTPEIPAKMTVRFPLNPAGHSSFIVFMTDYDTYAAVFTCQKLPASNRRSVTILSRRKTLEKVVIDKIRNRMSVFGVSPFDLSIVDHTKCPGANDELAVDVGIDPETFSSKNIAGAVRKVGEKIGDGIEAAAEGVGNAYKAI